MSRGWREQRWGEEIDDIEISPHFYQQVKPDDLEEWTPKKEEYIEKERQFFLGRRSADSETDASDSGSVLLL